MRSNTSWILFLSTENFFYPLKNVASSVECRFNHTHEILTIHSESY